MHSYVQLVGEGRGLAVESSVLCDGALRDLLHLENDDVGGADVGSVGGIAGSCGVAAIHCVGVNKVVDLKDVEKNA